MVLTVHHMDRSQSERILWLCEELSLPYKIEHHARNPTTALAPDSIKALHPAGTAPVFVDDDSPHGTGVDDSVVVLAESAAIVEYIIQVHGGGRLAVKPGEKAYAEYLNWFHYSNGSLQPTFGRYMLMSRMAAATAPATEDGSPPKPHPVVGLLLHRLQNSLSMLDARLKKTGAFLAGNEFTAADIMTMFTLTTMRGFAPVDLGQYEHLLAYLKRLSERPAYQKAMAKGDPDLTPMIGATVEPFKFG